MQLADIFLGLGEESFGQLLRSISLGKLKTFQLFDRLKTRLHVTKLNTETLRKVRPRCWERLSQPDSEDFATELAQAILISHLDMIKAVLDETRHSARRWLLRQRSGRRQVSARKAGSSACSTNSRTSIRKACCCSTSIIWAGNWAKSTELYLPQPAATQRHEHRVLRRHQGRRRGKVGAMIDSDPSLLSAKDENGLGAFTVARYSRQDAIAKLLLDKGVQLDIFAASMAGVTDASWNCWPPTGTGEHLQPRRLDPAASRRLLRTCGNG